MPTGQCSIVHSDGARGVRSPGLPDGRLRSVAASPVARIMKILTFTTLYPNAVQPNKGIFVENRLRALLAAGGISIRVIAPIPWFPFDSRIFGSYATFAKIPEQEKRFGIEVVHPRYPVVPKVGMSLAPFLMYSWLKHAIKATIRSGYDFDLIDAHYFYPDGVAAVMLGKRFGKPVVITGRGTDINVIPRYLWPRRMIRWAARYAAALITVSRALKDELAHLGVNPETVHVLRNGVDLELFRPLDREHARRGLGLEAPVLLSVGSLIPQKGHDLVIRALAELPEATLLVVGEGPKGPALGRLAHRLGLGERVRFLGAIDHHEMPEIYNAADLLLLVSQREGYANVLLEALACGTPVVASAVGGNSEIIRSPAVGEVLAERTPGVIAAAVRRVLEDPPERAETRAYAERFGWQETTRGQLAVFRDVLERRTMMQQTYPAASRG